MLQRKYPVLCCDDIIDFHEDGCEYKLIVRSIRPDGPAVSVVDTDCEVDFDPPLFEDGSTPTPEGSYDPDAAIPYSSLKHEPVVPLSVGAAAIAM